MKYKAILFDIDGTSIKDGQYQRPTPKVIEAVREAKEKVHVSSATGRPFVTAKWIFDDLDLSDPVIISEGAKIVDPKSGNILWHKNIEATTVERLLKIMSNFPYKVTVESQYSTFPEQPFVKIQDESFLYVISIPIERQNEIIEKLEVVSEITVSKIKSYSPDFIDLHITKKDATKENATMELISRLGLKKEEVVGVGDSFNDIHLLNAVGFKVAMGNGASELKEIADYVAPSVYEDGLVDVIEKFILSSY
ncbi:MAG TPA: HAD family hydrolase [Patescibacteria group bacterium]